MSQEPLWTKQFLLVCLTNFFTFISFHLFLPTLPVYIQVLGGESYQVGLVNGLFAFSAIAFRPLVGREIDRRGRTRILTAGILVFLLSTILYNFTNRIGSLLLLRVLHGAGWAAITTSNHALVADLASLPRRGEAMGFFGISANLGVALGPFFGLAIIGARAPHRFAEMFWTAAALALVSLLMACRVAEPDRPPFKPLPTEERTLGAFLYPAATVMALTFSFGTVSTFIPLHAQKVGVGNIGLFFASYAVTLMVVRPLAGAVSDARGRMVVILPGLLLVSLATLLLGFAGSLLTFLALAVLFGLGLGLTHPVLMALNVDLVPAHMKGAAMAFFTAAFDLGIGLGAIISGLVLQQTGFGIMYLVSAGFTLMGVLPISRVMAQGPEKKRDSYS